MAHKRLAMAVMVTDKGSVKKQTLREKTGISRISQLYHSYTATKRSKHSEIGALLILIAFVLLNMGCVTLLNQMPEPSEQIAQLIGLVPAVHYINIACALFVVSEVILTLCRSSKCTSVFHACKQLLFFSAFYSFFWAAGVLEARNFIPLFLAGVILLTSEYIRLLQITQKAAKRNVMLSK